MGDRELKTEQARWNRWLGVIQDQRTELHCELVGLPGHMRLPANWRNTGRLEREHLLYLVTQGKMRALVGGAQVVLERGDLLWVPPRTDFQCTPDGAGSLAILRCRLRIMRADKTVRSPWGARVFRGAGAAGVWLEWLVQEADHPGAWAELRLRSLQEGLFTEIARLDTQAEAGTHGLTPRQRREITRLLAESPEARATPRELARAAGLSYDYFSRAFRRSYGRSPRRWLVEQRIRLAALRLTETDLQVQEVAAAFGYADIFLFSRQFKAVTGLSPVNYRRSQARK